MAKKPRRWSNLNGVVPEHEEPISDRELKVRAMCDELREKPMNELALEYAGRVEEEEFETLASKKRSIEYEALERVILEQLRRVYELSGQDTWRGEGQLFSPQTTIIPVVYDKNKLMQYIKDSKQEHLLTIDGGRLKSLVVEVLESFQTMTPEERAEQTATPLEPLPGVKLFLKNGVHRTQS